MALTIGWLYAAGLYMLLRRSMIKLVIGLALLSHGSNLLVFMSGGLTRARPPLIPAGEHTLSGPITDPLPQALVLTAIVISFGVLAFTLVLIKRAYEIVGTDDVDALKATDQ